MKNLLFIIDEDSQFDANTQSLEKLYAQVDKATSKEKALKLFEKNSYDVVLSDLSVDPTKVGLLKQLQDMKKEQVIFAMLDPKDNDKLYGIADLGINAFELTPEHFDMALEEIAKFEVA